MSGHSLLGMAGYNKLLAQAGEIEVVSNIEAVGFLMAHVFSASCIGFFSAEVVDSVLEASFVLGGLLSGVTVLLATTLLFTTLTI